MNSIQRIKTAESRIKELQLLIRHWKASEASSEHIALELIEGLVTEDYERNAA